MEPKQMMRLVETTLRRFGGIERFAELWVGHIKGMKPGTPTMGRHLQATLRLIEVNDELNPEPDPSLLSDEDVERELEQVLEALLLKNPCLAAALDWSPTSELDGT